MPYQKESKLVLILAQTIDDAEILESEVQRLGHFTLSATNRYDFLAEIDSKKYGAVILKENCKYFSDSTSFSRGLGSRIARKILIDEPESRVMLYTSTPKYQIPDIDTLEKKGLIYTREPDLKNSFLDFLAN